jgi:hypothetical protein
MDFHKKAMFLIIAAESLDTQIHPHYRLVQVCSPVLAELSELESLRASVCANGDSGQKSDSNYEPDAGPDSHWPSLAVLVSWDPCPESPRTSKSHKYL